MFELDLKEKNTILEYTNNNLSSNFKFNYAGFADVPLLDKKNSLKFYNLPLTPGLKSYSSTGTSGNPKGINWSDDEDRWYIGEKRGLLLEFLSDCSRLFISLGVGHNSVTSPTIFSGSSIEVQRAGIGNINDHLDLIKIFSPEALLCSPSLLVSIIKNSKKQNVSLESVKKVILNGEVVYEGILNYYCRELNIKKQDILDTYGSTEVGTIAYSCNICNMYHFFPGIIPESLRAKDVKESLHIDEDILILNSLKRVSFPVIRFVTYDLIRGLSRTVCNNKSYYSYDRIIGRCDDVLNYGELLPAIDIINLIKQFYPEKDYLIFNYRNHVDIIVEGKPGEKFTERIYNCNTIIQKMIKSKMLEKFRIHFFDSLKSIREKHSIPTKSISKEGIRIIKQEFNP